jgi:hypothetical protein
VQCHCSWGRVRVTDSSEVTEAFRAGRIHATFAPDRPCYRGIRPRAGASHARISEARVCRTILTGFPSLLAKGPGWPTFYRHWAYRSGMSGVRRRIHASYPRRKRSKSCLRHCLQVLVSSAVRSLRPFAQSANGETWQATRREILSIRQRLQAAAQWFTSTT